MASPATLDARRPSGTTGLPVNGSSAGPIIRRRISVPRILLSTLLILGLALAGAVVANKVDTRVPVLAAARDLAAGQTITDADLVVVRIAAEAGVATLPDVQRSTVAGQRAAMPVSAGTLLHAGLLGDVEWPAAGQSAIAVAVKPGHAPAGLTAGSPVTVLVVPTAGEAGEATRGGQVVQARATVVSVEQAADQSGQQIVSLLLAGSDATKVASAAGEARLIQLGAGR